jgi:hypothetical protein
VAIPTCQNQRRVALLGKQAKCTQYKYGTKSKFYEKVQFNSTRSGMNENFGSSTGNFNRPQELRTIKIAKSAMEKVLY